MASTYENDLRLEEMATGENSGSWGTKTNTNLELIADAFSYGTEIIANADTTITIADGAADAARSLALKINSSEDLTTTRVVTLAPSTTSKVWIIENNTSGGQTLTISAGSGSNITLENGKTKIIATDGIGAGSNVVELTQDIAIADLFVDDDLTVGDDIIMDSDGAIINFGADSEIQLTHVADTGLLLTETGGGAPTLQIRDSALSISSSADGQLDIDADTEVQITAPTVDIDASTEVNISADLKVDTDTLYVDSANDRVGINTANPNSALEAVGGDGITISNSGDTFLQLKTTGSTATNYVEFKDSGGAAGSFSYNHTSNSLTTKVNGASAMTIDSSQRVLIGTGTARADLFNTTATAALQVEGTTGNTAAASIVRNSNDDNGPQFVLGKSNGTSVGSATVVTDDALLGRISYQGADGSELVEAARIESQVDGTPDANDMPGRLQFYTTPAGASSPVERMRITSDGDVAIGYTNGAVGDLHVQRSDGAVLWLGRTTNSGQTTASLGEIRFGDTAFDSNLASIHSNLDGSTSSSNLTFYTQATGAASALAMKIDLGQRVLIGYTANISTADHNAALQVVGQGTADYHGATTSIIGFSNNSNGAYLNFASGRSNTAGTYTIVANDDTVGQINFAAADGTDMSSRAAFINVNIDGAPSANDTPGRIIFGTTAAGASSPTERMRITSDAKVSINKSNPSYTLEVQTFGTNNGDMRVGGSSGNTATGLSFDYSNSGTTTATIQNNYATSSGSALLTIGSGKTDFKTGTSQSLRLRIDDGGEFLIGGQTTARSNFASTTSGGFKLGVEGTNADNTKIAAVRNVTGVNGPYLVLGHTRSSAVNGADVLAEDDHMGTLSFQGADGTGLREGANIRAEVDGALSGGGAADMPGRLIFSTTTDGAASTTERMRITSDGAMNLDAGSAAVHAMRVGTSAGVATDCFEINNSGSGTFACYVEVVTNQNGGYAGRTSQFLWHGRRATAGNSRGVVELSTNSLGSVNSGVVAVGTITASATNPTGTLERFQITTQYTTDTIYCIIRAIGNINSLKLLN